MPLHGLRILITEHHGSQSAVLAGLGPISETDAGGNRSVVRSREEGRARVINALVIVALVIIALEIIDQVVKELADQWVAGEVQVLLLASDRGVR